jgi:hypothetical protein
MRPVDCPGESRMRENLMSGLGRGSRKRGENHRACSLLHSCDCCWVSPLGSSTPSARVSVVAAYGLLVGLGWSWRWTLATPTTARTLLYLRGDAVFRDLHLRPEGVRVAEAQRDGRHHLPPRHRVHRNASPLVEVVARGEPEPLTFRFSVVWTIVRRINAHVATCTAALTEHQ